MNICRVVCIWDFFCSHEDRKHRTAITMIFSHRGFTLIEMMIVISIIAVMSAMMYAPFSYYQKLGVLRAGSNTLLQSVYSAKTFAANGVFLS